jgi:hypothetical protein
VVRPLFVDEHFDLLMVLMITLGVMLLSLGMLILSIWPVHAHDPAHPELDKWYMSLHNKFGVPCCDVSDGHALDVDDWKTDHGHYVVLLNGVWTVVPDEAVIDKEPNQARHAIVWMRQGPTPLIICFMPGEMM